MFSAHVDALEAEFAALRHQRDLTDFSAKLDAVRRRFSSLPSSSSSSLPVVARNALLRRLSQLHLALTQKTRTAFDPGQASSAAENRRGQASPTMTAGNTEAGGASENTTSLLADDVTRQLVDNILLLGPDRCGPLSGIFSYCYVFVSSSHALFHFASMQAMHSSSQPLPLRRSPSLPVGLIRTMARGHVLSSLILLFSPPPPSSVQAVLSRAATQLLSPETGQKRSSPGRSSNHASQRSSFGRHARRLLPDHRPRQDLLFELRS